jgi:hypothetical protein
MTAATRGFRTFIGTKKGRFFAVGDHQLDALENV